jgi:hypothetical protein
MGHKFRIRQSFSASLSVLKSGGAIMLPSTANKRSGSRRPNESLPARKAFPDVCFKTTRVEQLPLFSPD